MPTHLSAAEAPEDLWVCHECGWTYPNHHPSAKHRRNHKKQCGKLPGFTIVTPKSGMPILSHVGTGSSDDGSSDEEHRIHHSSDKAHEQNELAKITIVRFGDATKVAPKIELAADPQVARILDNSKLEGQVVATPKIKEDVVPVIIKEAAGAVAPVGSLERSLERVQSLRRTQLEHLVATTTPNGTHHGRTHQGRGIRSAHAVEGKWVCRHCGWTYPNAHPSAKHRRKHKKKCGAAGHTGAGGSSDDASSDEEHHLKMAGLENGLEKSSTPGSTHSAARDPLSDLQEKSFQEASSIPPPGDALPQQRELPPVSRSAVPSASLTEDRKTADAGDFREANGKTERELSIHSSQVAVADKENNSSASKPDSVDAPSRDLVAPYTLTSGEPVKRDLSVVDMSDSKRSPLSALQGNSINLRSIEQPTKDFITDPIRSSRSDLKRVTARGPHLDLQRILRGASDKQSLTSEGPATPNKFGMINVVSMKPQSSDAVVQQKEVSILVSKFTDSASVRLSEAIEDQVATAVKGEAEVVPERQVPKAFSFGISHAQLDAEELKEETTGIQPEEFQSNNIIDQRATKVPWLSVPDKIEPNVARVEHDISGEGIIPSHIQEVQLPTEKEGAESALPVAAHVQKDLEDLWVCRQCGWTYPNLHPSVKHRSNHKKNCGKVDHDVEESSDDESSGHNQHKTGASLMEGVKSDVSEAQAIPLVEAPIKPTLIKAVEKVQDFATFPMEVSSKPRSINLHDNTENSDAGPFVLETVSSQSGSVESTLVAKPDSTVKEPVAVILETLPTNEPQVGSVSVREFLNLSSEKLSLTKPPDSSDATPEKNGGSSSSSSSDDSSDDEKHRIRKEKKKTEKKHRKGSKEKDSRLPVADLQTFSHSEDSINPETVDTDGKKVMDFAPLSSAESSPFKTEREITNTMSSPSLATEKHEQGIPSLMIGDQVPEVGGGLTKYQVDKPETIDSQEAGISEERIDEVTEILQRQKSNSSEGGSYNAFKNQAQIPPAGTRNKDERFDVTGSSLVESTGPVSEIEEPEDLSSLVSQVTVGGGEEAHIKEIPQRLDSSESQKVASEVNEKQVPQTLESSDRQVPEVPVLWKLRSMKSLIQEANPSYAPLRVDSSEPQNLLSVAESISEVTGIQEPEKMISSLSDPAIVGATGAHDVTEGGAYEVLESSASKDLPVPAEFSSEVSNFQEPEMINSSIPQVGIGGEGAYVKEEQIPQTLDSRDSLETHFSGVLKLRSMKSLMQDSSVSQVTVLDEGSNYGRSSKNVPSRLDSSDPEMPLVTEAINEVIGIKDSSSSQVAIVEGRVYEDPANVHQSTEDEIPVALHSGDRHGLPVEPKVAAAGPADQEELLSSTMQVPENPDPKEPLVVVSAEENVDMGIKEETGDGDWGSTELKVPIAGPQKTISFGDWVVQPDVKKQQPESAGEIKGQEEVRSPGSPEGLVRARVEEFEKLAGVDPLQRRKSSSPRSSSSPSKSFSPRAPGTLHHQGSAEKPISDFHEIPNELRETISHLRHKNPTEKRASEAAEHDVPPEVQDVMSHLRHRHNNGVESTCTQPVTVVHIDTPKASKGMEQKIAAKDCCPCVPWLANRSE